jgi:predicted DNA-binding transcriptional regulator AlpA
MTIPESHSAPPGELLTAPEVMALMHVSKCRIYDLIMSDELRSVAIGRKSDGQLPPCIPPGRH